MGSLWNAPAVLFVTLILHYVVLLLLDDSLSLHNMVLILHNDVLKLTQYGIVIR